MKATVSILAILITAFTTVYAQQSILSFTNEYRGLRTGISTLSDVEVALGKPEQIDATINGHNYHLGKVIMNFSGSDKNTINTITIFNDHDYQTISGISIGDPVKKLSEKIPHLEEMGAENSVDFKEGICYQTDGVKITRITLCRSLLKDRKW